MKKETDMDQIKIGKFIAEMRKEQNLTQIDLAEKLGISNKTVSKWECGNGMPDYSVMESLCEALHINVNELLSGERLPSKEYNKKAEENMMSLMQENKKLGKWKTVIIILAMIGLLIGIEGMIIAVGGLAAIHNFSDMVIITYMTIILISALAISGLGKDFLHAIPYAFKGDMEEVKVKKSLLAIKFVIIMVNIEGVLFLLISFVASINPWVSMDLDPKVFSVWMAVAMLSVFYALVVTLILIPIYMRLKAKLIEE